jgi:hypothetical protein
MMCGEMNAVCCKNHMQYNHVLQNDVLVNKDRMYDGGAIWL